MLMCNVFAQSSALPAISPTTKVTVPLAFVIQAEKNADKLGLLETENESLKAQVAALNDKDANHVKLEANLQAKIDSLETSLKKAEEQRDLAMKNTGLTEQQKQLYVDRVNELRGELDATRKDLDSCRSSKKWWALGGAAAGAGATIWATKK